MDLVQSAEHLCYIQCNFCTTVLAVGIPRKRLLETVTVKCGHCSNLSFLSNKPSFQTQSSYDHQSSSFCSELKKGVYSSASSSASTEPLSLKAPFVVKPPEKKHRLPSAYNRFMKKYNASKLPIQRFPIERLSVQQPKIGLARYIPTSSEGSISNSNNTAV